MFLHIVLLKFNNKADQEFFLTVDAFVKQIQATCPGIIVYNFGDNKSNRSNGYTHATTSVFTTSAQHDAYQSHPTHQEMKAYMAEYIESMVVYDGEIQKVICES